MRKLLFVILLTQFFLVCKGQTTSALPCLIDQNQPLTDGGTSERNLPGYYDGQTFTAGRDGLLCEIDLLMFNTMTGTGTLNIYDGSGIAGPLLTTQPVNVYVPSGQVWQQWSINSPPQVYTDSVYTFQFVPTQGGGLPDPYGINIEGSNVYAGGYDLTFPQFDMTFKTYIDETTDIIENNSSSFNIYPNPAQEKFTISLGEELTNRDAELTITDLTGRILYCQSRIQKLSIITLKFDVGIYFVRIRSGAKNYVRKMVVE